MRLHAKYNDFRHSLLRRGKKCLITQHFEKFGEGEREGRERERERESKSQVYCLHSCKSQHTHTVHVLDLSQRLPKSIFISNALLYRPYSRPVCQYVIMKSEYNYIMNSYINTESPKSNNRFVLSYI